VARLPPFREVRSFAPPPRGGFALSLVAAGHNSMHSGVCLHTRRCKWCKLLYNTLLSLRAELCRPRRRSTARLPPPSYLGRRPIGFAPHGRFAFIATPERQRLYIRLYIIVLTWRCGAYSPYGHFSQCLGAGKPRGRQKSAA
jgi:transposase InsO family protein